jgi:type II secretory pathway component PulC
MNKKTISLAFLLIVLVSVTVSYAFFTQPATDNNTPTDSGETIDDSTIASEVDSLFLDENQDIEIGEMI